MLLQQLNTDSWEIGVDEVGRGCLWGPVIACAVTLPKTNEGEGLWGQIKDSKKLTAKKREKLHDFIVNNAISIGIGIVSETEIDSMNILGATMKAMHLAISDCISRLPVGDKRVEALIDGSYFLQYNTVDKSISFQHKCVVKGDSKYLSIAAASIVAKYTRDKYVSDLVTENPDLGVYQLGRNKGYGTKAHIKALHKYGPHKMHRRSFKPLSHFKENI